MGAWVRALAAVGVALRLAAPGPVAAAEAPATPAEAPVTIVCGSVPQSRQLCREGSEAWAKARGREVRVLTYPDSTTRARDLVRELLEAGVEDLDVLELDLVWPGGLAPYLLDLKDRLGEEAAPFFPAAAASFTVDGRLVAAPWYLSVGRLFYRQDLLARYGVEPPRTWEELAASARRIQEGERAAGASGFWGFAWQGRAGEGLTANAIEWLASQGAPPLLGADGTPGVDDPRAAAALAQAASWVDTITPAAVLDMGGGQSLESFARGEAAFLRYWSNGRRLAEAGGSAVAGKVGVGDLPAGAGEGARSAGVLGGFGLAVARRSTRPEPAVDLVRWLTSPAEQKRRALAGGFDPSRPALYADPELLAARPDYRELRPALEAAVLRPAGAARGGYDAVSQIFADSVHRVLAREVEPAPGLAAVAAALRRLGPARQRSGG